MLWYSCQIIDSKITIFVGITSVLASFTDAFSIRTASNKTVAVLMENTTSMMEENQGVIVILLLFKKKKKKKKTR